MHPADCPTNWDYESPRNDETLRGRCIAILIRLRGGGVGARATLSDSRPYHLEMFEGMTPHGYDYFAGHYRGSAHRCLRHYNVGIRSDAIVGARSETVVGELAVFAKNANDAVSLHELATIATKAALPEEDRLLYLVSCVCLILCEFLRIHPYANGNGHISRLIVWSILGHFHHWPKAWPLEQRPPDPPYSELLKKYRRGDKKQLENFVLDCIRG